MNNLRVVEETLSNIFLLHEIILTLNFEGRRERREREKNKI